MSYLSIAAAVNAAIDGAAVTVPTLRWYSCKMRQSGIKVKRDRRGHQVETG
jgi:flavin-binding protein dodecin